MVQEQMIFSAPAQEEACWVKPLHLLQLGSGFRRSHSPNPSLPPLVFAPSPPPSLPDRGDLELVGRGEVRRWFGEHPQALTASECIFISTCEQVIKAGSGESECARESRGDRAAADPRVWSQAPSCPCGERQGPQYEGTECDLSQAGANFPELKAKVQPVVKVGI